MVTPEQNPKNWVISCDLTQAEVAETLGTSQPKISRLEGQEDMQISTLAKLVRALGGELELSVKLPNGRVRLAQF